jgi:hypothetical protein
MKRFLHFFLGHNWSDWELKIYSPHSYDKERWYQRICDCGAVEEREY